MKNTCPKCDTAYNVTASAVGRKFTCKNCGTPVVVTEEGLDYQNPPAAAAPAPAAPGPAAGGGGAFDFDAAGDEEERKPVKAAKKGGKPAKNRDEDEEEEEQPAPKKAKSKKAEPEPEEEDDADALPARKAKKKGGSDKNMVKDFLFFKEFIAPLFVKLIFFLSIAGLVLGGIGVVIFGLISGSIGTILGGLCSAVIFVPMGIFMVRVYCELVLLGFSVYDRLGEIKNLLEKGQATAPAEPPAPPTP